MQNNYNKQLNTEIKTYCASELFDLPILYFLQSNFDIYIAPPYLAGKKTQTVSVAVNITSSCSFSQDFT